MSYKNIKKAASVLIVLTIFLISILNISKFNTSAATQTTNPFANIGLFVDSTSHAYKRSQEPYVDFEQIKKIAYVPQASWYGGWNGDIKEDVNKYVSRSSNLGLLPVLVAYNIPFRDCNGYSAGGASSANEYRRWIDQFSQGIGNRRAVIMLEPDGLGLMNCLSSNDQQTRIDLYKYAIDKFTQNSGTAVYIDVSMWMTPQQTASQLKKIGMNKARGVVVNISGFQTTQSSLDYIKQVKSYMTEDIHGVIDTSRNGVGPTVDNQWCNPWERALGIPSTSRTSDPILDAYFWVKRPGESDGNCNGGPNAGSWWEDYALDLARRSTDAPIIIQPTVTPTPEVTPIQTPTPTLPQASTIKIYAAGSPMNGVYPEMELYVRGNKVKTFSSVSGNPYNRNFNEYVYSQNEKIKSEDVRINFVNDSMNANEDRNLLIDKINIDGIDLETESNTTQSTGTWESATGCNSGYKKSEWLHCGGYFQFGVSAIIPTPEPTQVSTPVVTPTESPTASVTITQIPVEPGITITPVISPGITVIPEVTMMITPSPVTPTPVVTLIPTSVPTQIPTQQPTQQPTLPSTSEDFFGTYFNNKDLSGNGVFTKKSGKIDFDWGEGSPDTRIMNNNFSVRWTKTQNFSSGNYNFTITGDDGYRLYIDNVLIVDRWINQAPFTTNISKYLSSGNHDIKLEYFESGMGAQIKFDYTKN